MNPQVLEPELVYLDSQLLSISEMKKERTSFSLLTTFSDSLKPVQKCLHFLDVSHLPSDINLP